MPQFSLRKHRLCNQPHGSSNEPNELLLLETIFNFKSYVNGLITEHTPEDIHSTLNINSILKRTRPKVNLLAKLTNFEFVHGINKKAPVI